jgi:hypothetical protein
VPKCDRYFPVLFEYPEGHGAYARFAADGFQTFDTDRGPVTLVEMDSRDADFRRSAERIPHTNLLASGTVVRPPEGAPTAARHSVRRGEENRSRDAATSETKTAPPDPLQETLELIPRAACKSTLIKFVYEKSKRTATAIEVSKRLYKSVDKSSLAKARLLIKRTGLSLERKDAPLRVLWDKGTGKVQIVDR